MELQRNRQSQTVYRIVAGLQLKIKLTTGQRAMDTCFLYDEAISLLKDYFPFNF